MAVMPDAPRSKPATPRHIVGLVAELLPGVSRSFYLTLRVLPGSIRPQIGLAYLLARATDTVADTRLLPVTARLDALDALRQRILGTRRAPLDFGPLTAGQALPAERRLLERIEDVLAALAALDADDQARIRTALAIITSGQELDLRRFGDAGPDRLKALQTESELYDYTYRVAGCVGEFWTRMCRAHLSAWATVDEAFLLRQGVRFGQGLQLVNILRDLPADLRQGRCYVPAALLAAHGLAPTDLLDRTNAPRFRPLYHALLDMAQAHLAAGWDYTRSLPRSCVRVRLACAWPLLIGARTLALLRQANILDPTQRIKVPRHLVRQLIFQSILRYPWERAWDNLFAKAALS